MPPRPGSRRRETPGSPTLRPAVVEPADSPRSASDGRATLPSGTAAVGLDDRLRTAIRRRPPVVDQVATFAVIGVASTIAWTVLYMLLRSVLPPTAANAVALVVTAIGNTAANRRLTFGVRGRHGLARDQGAGLLAFALALALTSGAAAGLPTIAPHASRFVELAVLTVANAVATAIRFVVLRASIGRRAMAPG